MSQSPAISQNSFGEDPISNSGTNLRNYSKTTASPNPRSNPLSHSQSQSQINYPISQVPEWMQRSYQSYGFLQNTDRHSSERIQKVDLSSFDVKIQELMLIEQLLNAMMGFDDEYIRCVRDIKTKRLQFYFTMSQSEGLKNQSLQEIVERILPLCSAYVNICEFIEEYSRFQWGTVSHALCATLKYLLKEYLIVVATLEHEHKNQKISLQNLWFYIQPSLKTIITLERLTATIKQAQVKGGAMLRCIQNFSLEMSGDMQIKQMTHFLIERASVPYFAMLEAWIYKGEIQDPYEEFMVRDTQQILRNKLVYNKETHGGFTDVYWNSRYRLLEEQCPKFLEQLAPKIFSTGKYLNVIRECQVDVDCPFAEPIKYTSNNEREYTEKIERAYLFACNKLMEVFMKEQKLVERLKSIKHYFLMDESDFIVHFMDSAEEELAQYSHLLHASRLNSLLEIAIRTSSVADDPYKESVSCSLGNTNLIGYLKEIHRAPKTQDGSTMEEDDNVKSSTNIFGYEAFTLNYEVGWPLSLVINKRAIEKYQLLFRHIFQCKYVEREICNSYIKGKFTREFSCGNEYTKLNILKHRMLDFVRNFQYYMVQVIEKNFQLLLEKLQNSVTTIEDIMQYHNDFLDTCLRASLLSVSVPIFQNLNKIFRVCKDFSNFISQYMSALSSDYAQYSNYNIRNPLELQRERNLYMSEISSKHANNYKFVNAVDKFSSAFDSNLAALSVKLKTISQNQSISEQANQLIQLIKINVG